MKGFVTNSGGHSEKVNILIFACLSRESILVPGIGLNGLAINHLG